MSGFWYDFPDPSRYDDSYEPLSAQEKAIQYRAYDQMRMQVQAVGEAQPRYIDLDWYAVDGTYEYGKNDRQRYRRGIDSDNNATWEEIASFPEHVSLWVGSLLHLRPWEFYQYEKIRQAQVILHWLKNLDPDMLLTTSNHRSYRKKIVSNTLVWLIKDRLGFLPPDVLKDAMNDWEVSLPDKTKIQVKDVLSILGYQSK